MLYEKKDTELITVVIQRGYADKVIDAAIKSGAQAATTFYARGTGVREKLGFLGVAIAPEKEVFFIVIEKEKTGQVFDAIIKAGKLDQPGNGFVFVQEVARAYGFLEEE
ncbi:MAG: P-II family nitrogen regulator [Candidatus Ancaeobacter aquaticus]|nr:P-II family nitrogen regulator [Candidatus Ancaeobacter aquaticus]